MAWKCALLFAAIASAIVTEKTVVPNRYIVEFEDGADVSSLNSKIDSGEVRTRKKFDYQLFKGASIELNRENGTETTLKDIKDMPGVKVWPVTMIPRPNDEVVWVGRPDPPEAADMRRRQEEQVKDEFSTHVQTQIDLLRAEGITGKGVKVAVIDTGIDYNHPALGGCFGSDCLVSFGTDLVGDDYLEGRPPVPGNDPMDCAGHGTHVAGTIAAQQNEFNFTGAAPGAKLGAYKVFGCQGGVGNDVLIDAFNQAFEDGADIITASIGGPSGWSEEPWGVAVQRIVEKGVPCTLAAGNEGASGMWFAATASSAKGVLSVGSVDNTVQPQLLIESNYAVDGGDTLDFGWAPGTPTNWQNVSAPLQAQGFDITNEEDGCVPWSSDSPSLAGKIALIRRGTCTFVEKARLAAQRGAEYVIFYNNEPGVIPVEVFEVQEIKAVAMVASAVGEEWIKELEGGAEVVVTMVNPDDVEPVLLVSGNNATGGYPSIFTSWGPTFEMDVKPIVSAPGGNILSTYPIDLGQFGVLSGTSMSTPLVAGVLALLAEARGSSDPSLLERLLGNTAEPMVFNAGDGAGQLLAPVPQQGNGIIRAYDAAFTKVVLDKSSISFNDSDHRPEAMSFKITNEGDEDVTFELINIAAATAYTKHSGDDAMPMAFPNDLIEEHAELTFDPAEVTVPAGGEAEVSVTATPPDTLDEARLPVWSGWISLNATDGQSLRLAYQGLSGSLNSQTVMNDAYLIIVPPAATSLDFALEHAPENLTFVLPPKGLANQTLLGLPVPGVAFDLSMGTGRIELEILTADGQSVGTHRESPLMWLSRVLDFMAWDGELAGGEFADEGQYKFRTRSLKIYGDVENEDDWEVKESTVFGIEYLQVQTGPI